MSDVKADTVGMDYPLGPSTARRDDAPVDGLTLRIRLSSITKPPANRPGVVGVVRVVENLGNVGRLVHAAHAAAHTTHAAHIGSGRSGFFFLGPVGDHRFGGQK